jgi:hypothetical protein
LNRKVKTQKEDWQLFLKKKFRGEVPGATSNNLQQPPTTSNNLQQPQTTSNNLKQPQTTSNNL